MSTMLRFKHWGWDVCTASWTAGSKNDRQTVVCYLWAVDQGSWKATFDIPFEAFMDRIARGGIVDLGPAL